MSRGVLALCLLVVSGASAALVQPASLRSATRYAAPRRASPACMVVPDVTGSTAIPAAVAVVAAPSVLVADAFDLIAGFANSPLVLLVPIGAGSLVAAAIIYILVKSAG